MCLANHYTPPMHCHVRPFVDLVICTAERLTRLESFVENIVSSLPADPDRLLKYCDALQKDDICSRVIAFCKKGWPKKEQMSREMLPYWRVRGELTLCRDLLLRGKRIVVPARLRTETWKRSIVFIKAFSDASYG